MSVIFALLFSCPSYSQKEPQELTILFHAGNSPPFAFTENGKIVGGIIRDIGDELGKRLNINISYFFTSRSRLDQDLIDGKADLSLINNRDWTPQPDKFFWGKPIFQERDVLLSRRSTPLIRGIGQLKGKRVGTIFSYVYPTLDKYFLDKEIFRDDVYQLEQNFRRLEKGNIDYLVDSDILINYELKRVGRYGDFIISPFLISGHDISPSLSPVSHVDHKLVLKEIERLRISGKIEEILSRYR